MLHEYETVVIIRPDLDDPTTLAIIEKLEVAITGAQGTILLRDDWGKRKLAYPIGKQQKGHYVLLNYLSMPELLVELERKLRIDDNVVRFLTTKLADAVDVPTRIEQAAETRRIREEQARVRAEQEAREAELGEVDDDDEPAYS